ncbi:hypothetical protein EXN66_Car010289 [Channa argus]|uniref:Uncharacterized protein n=1 Tax=Channa argus TaxID=215402 RepID=A0A6G1PWQ6_CHAAH|nr:hypothetical protein EXN66_Car010289 [Channa argus]
MAFQTSFCTATFSSSSGGIMSRSQGPDGIYNPSNVFWVYHRVSYELGTPGRPPAGGAQEAFLLND